MSWGASRFAQQPGLPWHRPPAVAWILAASAVASVVAAGLIDRVAASPIWLALVGIIAVCWWILRRRSGAIADAAAHRLDERELLIRNCAAWWGQAVMLSLGAALALTFITAARLHNTGAASVLHRSGGLLLSCVILSAAVPTVVVSMLTAPDEDEQDLADDA